MTDRKMTDLRPVRGTRDLLPDDNRVRGYIEGTAARIAGGYGYGELTTPIFEFTEVFQRTLGDTSDIVTKEMYTFADRNGDSLTLRPENTAGIVRAVLSNGLLQQLPLRLFYRGPMFRYERPQKGRLRQFRQVGVELLGVADPLADVEVIGLAYDLLAALGLADRVTLEINTLGDAESRIRYRADLVAYLADFRDRLSDDSRLRLEHNPLRILDSKDAGDRAIVAGAPRLVQSLNAQSSDYFAQVLASLADLGMAARPSDRLVRGLDYYCHTIFEFTTDALGAQGTVLAGGRYDGLVEQMGGPSVPGTGWAAGVERLMLLAADVPAATRPIAVVPLGAEQAGAALNLARRLRGADHPVVFGFAGSLKKQLSWANRIGARLVVILGSDEVARAVAAVRDMDTGRQEEVALAGIEDRLAARPA